MLASQIQKEILQLLWLLIDPVQLGCRAIGQAGHQTMLLIGPIHSDPQDDVLGGDWLFRNVLLFAVVVHTVGMSRKLWTSEGLIASRRNSRPLRIR